MEIFDKLKDLGLSEENLVEIKTSFKDQVDEAVALKLTTESEKIVLSEAEKSGRKLEEEMEAFKVSLTAEYDNKMIALDEKLVDALDQFLDSEISEKISDSMLEKIAINETLVPLFSDLRSLFEEKYIEMDTEGEGILRSAKKEIETLEDSVSTEISEKIDLKKELDITKAKLTIATKTAGLTQNESDRVEKFLSGKSLAEVTKTIDNLIEVVTKNDGNSEVGAIHENVDAIADDEPTESPVENIDNVQIDENEMLKAVEAQL